MVVGLGRANVRPDKCSGGEKSVKKKRRGEKKKKKSGRVFSNRGQGQKLGREGSNLTPL